MVRAEETKIVAGGKPFTIMVPEPYVQTVIRWAAMEGLKPEEWLSLLVTLHVKKAVWGEAFKN